MHGVSERRGNDVWEQVYAGGASLTGFLVFFGTWIYCIAEYGFLLGVGLGWLPSFIVAVIAAALWPLIALVILLAVGGFTWAVLTK